MGRQSLAGIITQENALLIMISSVLFRRGHHLTGSEDTGLSRLTYMSTEALPGGSFSEKFFMEFINVE